MPFTTVEAVLADARRPEILRRYRLLERIGDPHLQRFARLAALSLNAPVALVAVADGEEFLLLNAVGPGDPWASGCRLRADETYCALALSSVEGMVVEDARQLTHRCSATIDGESVAAYAGVPLVLDGSPVGVLCVSDARPRPWSAQERRALEDLGALVVREWTLGLASASSLQSVLDAERFHSLSAGAFDATAIHDRGELVEVNDAFCEFLMQPRDMLIGRSCQEFLTPASRDAAHLKALSLREEFHETTLQRAGGEQVEVEVRSKPITFDGRTMRLMVVRDLTPRRDAIRALEVREALLRGIADSVTDPLFARDLEGRYLFANATCASLHGVDVETMVSQRADAFAPPEKNDLFQRTDHEVLGGVEVFQAEECVEVEGEERFFQARKAPLRLRSGEVIGVVGVARDITAVKQVEKALRDTGTRLAAVVRAQQEIALAGLNLDSVMLTIAERASELTGASGAVVELVEGDELVYRAATGALAPHLGQRIKVQGSLSGLCSLSHVPLVCEDSETDPRVNLEISRREGARSMLLVPLGGGGSAIGVLKVVSPRPAAFGEVEQHVMALMAGLMGAALRDAAAFDAEQGLLRELEHSNAALADFARVASHDLQEPLRKIRGFGARLLTHHADPLEPAGRDCVERMDAAAQRMQALIDDLLDFARTTRGLPPVEAVELGLEVEEVLSELAEQIAERGARVEVSEMPAVIGHPTQVRQMLRNLVANALKFHRPGVEPRIQISASFIRGPGSPSGWVELRIDDNGIGFEPRFAGRIFEIFERLHGRSAYPGTGIGLALCKRIVEHHAGTIRAEGRPDEGATFVVRLPAALTPSTSSLAGSPADGGNEAAAAAGGPQGGAA